MSGAVFPIHGRDERLVRARLALEGLSVGDAFGEGFFGTPSRYEKMVAQRIVPLGRWAYTDDTVMALGIFKILARMGRIDQDALAHEFALAYLADPRRGYGATAHDILAQIGREVPWRQASTQAFHGQGSMGNGAAMRVAPLGAFFAEDLSTVVEQARRSAEVTHAHPEGQAGAIAVAVAAAWACKGTQEVPGQALLETVLRYTPDGDTKEGVQKALSLPFDSSVQTAVALLGNGSAITSRDTVPFSLWCAARHLGDYREALWSTVSGMGDLDTTCAIVGGIVALAAGESSIPGEWKRARETLPPPLSP